MTAALIGHRIQVAMPEPIPPYENKSITVDELEQIMASGRFSTSAEPDRLMAAGNGDSVLLTLDDGYAVAREDWLRVIERHGIHTVIFVTTGFVDGLTYPFEETLWSLLLECDSFTCKAGRGHEDRDVSTLQQKLDCYNLLSEKLRGLSSSQRQAGLEELADINGAALPDPPSDTFFSWDELGELARHPLVSLGAHTVTHPVLPKLSISESYEEIMGSKARLEEVLGDPIDCFSYPYGANNWLTRRLVKRAGFRLAFSTRRGYITRGTNRLRIPRVNVRALADGD